MLDAFADLRPELSEPTAVLLVSAHWESDTVSVTAADTPGLLYDYYGFPEESYQITYPAPGAPDLARDVHARLGSEGLAVRLEFDRGFDHGMFVPMKLLFPDANVPTVQVSLKGSLDPAEHLAIGRALEGLRDHGVMIIGSGLTFHNVELLSPEQTPHERVVAANLDFHEWLDDTLTRSELDEHHRISAMSNWEDAPAARLCHPREEHLLPLHVCVGAARSPATRVVQFDMLGFGVRCYVWSSGADVQAKRSIRSRN